MTAGLLALLCLLPLLSGEAAAASGDRVQVVYNRNMPESRELALHYLAARRLPATDLITLATSDREEIAYAEFDRTIFSPIARRLNGLPAADGPIILVLMYGVPLKTGPLPVAGEKEKDAMTAASVDSELSLVFQETFERRRWLPNPWFAGRDRERDRERLRRQVVLVSRLDGPDPATVRRLIDDARRVEEKGLAGTVCIDARGMRGDSAYDRFDAGLRSLAAALRRQTSLPVVLDVSAELMPTCPEPALYCGWYGLGRYQGDFRWRQGAVAYHVASGEAVTLRRRDSKVWCKRLLEEGVAATVGPVAEPYLQSFPLPEIFFPLLLSGTTLVEAYYRSLPFLSWRQVLVGDPLYRPFAARPPIILPPVPSPADGPGPYPDRN
ncbi:MAG: TIGR03790 family protein [Thermodesulfobacteriota bacterium]